MACHDHAPRWRRLLDLGGRQLLLGQRPAGGPFAPGPNHDLRHLPTVGLLVGYRIRRGVGDGLADWIEHRLASRGRRLAPAATVLGSPRGDGAAPIPLVVVVPLGRGAVPDPDWPPLLGPGTRVGIVSYGPAGADPHRLHRCRDRILERGAQVVDQHVLVDATEFRAHGVPSTFEQMTAEVLLDELLAPSPSRGPTTEERP